MERTAYIDGDILPYTVGFATQRNIHTLDIEGVANYSPFFVSTSKKAINDVLKQVPFAQLTTTRWAEEPMQALNTLKIMLDSIVQGSGCKLFKVVLSGEDNFRNDIATIQPYKGNRTDFEKPVHWQYLRNWLADKPYTIMAENEEADDVVSRAMIAGHVGCTIDKDLDNTPGTHYNFRKGEVYEVTDTEAFQNFYRQCLTGDVADNIPGIKGIGAVKSKRIVSQTDPYDMERAVLDVYREHYDDPIAALTEVGRLLWMRREENEMWEPLTCRS